MWGIKRGQTPGNYGIRVTRLDAGMAADVSNALFAIAVPTTVYYVNDGIVETGDWTTEPGSDTNPAYTGLEPARPKASIQAVLNAYDLGPGDTIRVDSGTYNLTANILVAADDSGVVIEGYLDAAFPTRRALINRGNTAIGSWAFQFTGADDVTLDHLAITGAYTGVMAATGVDSDRIRITNSEIFNNARGGISMDTSNEFQQITGNTIYHTNPIVGSAGIELLSTSGATVNENTVHDIYTGIYVLGAFSQTTPNLIAANHVYGNTFGIDARSSGGNYPIATVQGNDVHNNSSNGILGVTPNVVVTGNSVHHNPVRGISGLDVRDNTVFDNGTGIDTVGSNSRASGNRVYRNTVGIATGNTGTVVENNVVYSNATGIDFVYSSNLFHVRNNLVYDNSAQGIRVRLSNGARLENNTIYQPGSGNAVRVEGSSTNIVFKGHIVSVASGYGIDVANDSQNGFSSDYNTIHTAGTGKIGRWQGRDFTNLTDWFYELGLDQHSQSTDPQFVNSAGADGILGNLNGLDDDFHVTTMSPTIDAGDPTDIFNNEPNPHGGRINQGHTGNRSDATISLAQFTQVLSPFGNEKLEHNQQLDIRWRTVGIPEPGGTYIDSVLAQSPVAYYRLGEGSGTTAMDSSGNGRHGTYVNVGNGLTLGVPGSMAAETDTAISVTNPGSVTVPDSTALRPAQITLEAWINPDLTITSNSSALMKTTSTSWNDGYGMIWQSDKLRFFVNSYNGAGKVEATITKGQWSHVVGTYDGTALKIYVNGTQVASTSYATAISHATQALYVGSSFGNWNWKGKLDEVAVYSGALSATQVAQHYARGTRPVYGSVDIELLAPGNPTPVATIAQTTPNDGQFTWTIPASVAEGEYLVRVRANEGIQPSDTSDASFKIANAGVHYYVNDNSLSGDVFTTVAGNNAFTGKRPDQPMSSLAAVLAAYDLDAGDVIHVDAGTYNLVEDIQLTSQDSGVRIEGPMVAAGAPPAAILNRGNTTAGNFVFQISGADDVTLDHLAITGGYYGINVADSSGSDRLVVTSNEIYGNPLGSIYLGSLTASARVEANRIHDNGQYGINASFVSGLQVRNNEVFNHSLRGINVSSANSGAGNLVVDNDVHNNALGIFVGAGVLHADVVDNRVFANTFGGISVSSNVSVSGNEVYSNADGYGISANSAVVDGNILYGNKRGIEAAQSQILNNRIYANLDEGVVLDLGGSGVGVNVVERNAIYDNEVGIHIDSNDNTIRSNLIYDNFGGGVWVRSATNVSIDGNTIYQPTTGDAVQMGGTNPVSFLSATGGVNVTLRNNILWVVQAYGIRMSPDSERGFVSNYNDVYATGTGKLGRWEDREFTNRGDWFFETGNDQHSIVGDPQFIDVDGPDNILGYNPATSTDGGLDDNFGVLATSPTIDAGDPLAAFSSEPVPNGGRLNLGSTGNTAAAASSPTQLVQVLSPNGLEKLEAGQAVTISWRGNGLPPNSTANVEFSADNGANWSPIANSVAFDVSGNGSYLWTPTSETSGNTALVRVRANQGTQPQDTSDAAFLVTNGGQDFYVNNSSLTDDVFTTAIGDNLASGKNPARPMATLAALLAAYDLDTGDVIHVDSGTYRLYRSVLLGAQDSGARIEGPGAVAEGQATGAIATLNRGNASTGQYVIELAGVDDATIDHLSLTGAAWGVHARNASGSHRVTVSHNDIFGNNGNPSSLAYGVNIEQGNNDTRILNNRIHNNAGTIISRGIATAGPQTLIEGNEVYGQSTGIESFSPGSSNPADAAVIRNNIVRDNTSYGIYGYVNDQVTGNTVFGHSGFNDLGILGWGSIVRSNTVYGNYDGIVTNAGVGSQVLDNRIYNNSHYGVLAYAGSIVNGNQIYSNPVGLFAQSLTGTVGNNLVYSNTNQGIVVSGSNGPQILSNTIYHPVGDAVRFQSSTSNVAFRDNVVWVDSGYDIYVDASSQAGFVSNHNLLHQSTDPNAFVGFWAGANRDTLANWQAATGQDANSVAADPLFVDRDGADNVLGYRTTDGFNGGLDDNFHVMRNSPVIDRGDRGTFYDRDGNGRVDDPGTPNLGPPEYFESLAAGHTFQTTGTAQNWRFDDGVWTWNLPFTFSFYGTNYTTAFVSSNGLLQFGSSTSAFDGTNTEIELKQFARIAPLWDDLTTLGTSDDIFIDTSVAGQATIRWNATNKADGSDVNMSVTLFPSGQIRVAYGPGNTNLTPTVGVSKGNNRNYTLSVYDSQSTLTNVASRQFDLGTGISDVGAYEFLGSSLDSTPPTLVTSVIETTLGVTPVTQVRLTFSEPIDPIDAVTASNYQLREAGLNGLFGDGDDTIYSLQPHYVGGSTLVTLDVNVAGGILPYGNYQLFVSGNTSIHDVSGNRLDGDNNGTPGGDYVRANAQPRLGTVVDQTVGEGQLLSVAITATDPSGGTTRTFSLEPGAPAGAAINPTTGLFTWTPTEAQGPGVYSVGVRVTDNGVPVMSDVRTFQITVSEVNVAPVIASIGNQTVNELSQLSVPVVATDSDLPANQLTYSLQAGSPVGAAIDPVTGLFTWTPTEAQEPGEYDITLIVTDNGSPNLSGTRTFHVSVAEVNTAPSLPFIPDKSVQQGQLLFFQVAAIDTDLPANNLLFSLDSGAPSGASIDAQTGVFQWLPGPSVTPGNYVVTVRVNDQGLPALSDTRSFMITVTPPPTVDGDFNNDGVYNALDIDALVGVIAAGSNNASYDLTGDGVVNLLDRDAWLVEAGGVNLGPGRSYLLGDATLDGVVDGQDFIRWNTNKFTVVAAWSKGDFNADGFVDGQDFIIWNTNKFTSSAGRGSQLDSRHVSLSGRVRSRDEADVDRYTLKKQQRDVDAVFAQLENDRLDA